jgi:hypothetical protein
MQHNQIAIVGKRCSVPRKPIDAVAAKRDLPDDTAVAAEHQAVVTGCRGGLEEIGWRCRRATGPVEIHEWHRREVRVKRDSKQTALGVVVHREIDGGANDLATDHVLDPGGVLLEHQLNK